MKQAARVAVLRGPSATEPVLVLPDELIEVTLDARFDDAALARLSATKADVVLLDLRGISGSPKAPIAAARAALPNTPIVMVGTPGDETMAQAAVTSGASGYVSRDPTPVALLAAIQDAARGSMHLTRTGRRAIQRLMSNATPSK